MQYSVKIDINYLTTLTEVDMGRVIDNYANSRANPATTKLKLVISDNILNVLSMYSLKP